MTALRSLLDMFETRGENFRGGAHCLHTDTPRVSYGADLSCGARIALRESGLIRLRM